MFTVQCYILGVLQFGRPDLSGVDVTQSATHNVGILQSLPLVVTGESVKEK